MNISSRDFNKEAVPGGVKEKNCIIIITPSDISAFLLFFRMKVSLEMDSISPAVETPSQNQIEGVPSEESSPFIAKPPKGLGGTKTGHQRKRGFRKMYRKSVQKGGNPSLARRCTSYCQILLSFLASMVTWAQLKTIVILIQLLTFARTTFDYCKVLVTWAQLKTLAILFSLMRVVKTMFGLFKVILKLCFTSYDFVSDFLQGK